MEGVGKLKKIMILEKERSNRGKVFWWAVSLTVLFLFFAGLYFYLSGMGPFYRQFGFYFLKPSETQWPAGSREAIRALLGPAKGKVVWGSSRTGSHQIFLMTLPELTFIN